MHTQLSCSAPERPIDLIQLTDAHLGEQPGSALLNLDTDQSLARVLALLRHNHAQPVPVLLATGDLSNDGSIVSYRRFRQLTDPLAEHVFWLPGNHDEPAVMAQATADGAHMSRTVKIGRWLIVLLDSKRPGRVGGQLAAAELEFLRQTLQQYRDSYILVCLHHHPMPIGCAWLDQQVVSNGSDLLNLLAASNAVRGLLWGHVHQQLDTLCGHYVMMCSPSTCIQFAPHSDDFKLDAVNPGYRHIRLLPDGSIETAVHRVDGPVAALDYRSAKGY